MTQTRSPRPLPHVVSFLLHLTEDYDEDGPKSLLPTTGHPRNPPPHGTTLRPPGLQTDYDDIVASWRHVGFIST